MLATSGVEEGIEGLRVVERDDGVGAGSREKGRKKGTSVSDPKTDVCALLEVVDMGIWVGIDMWLRVIGEYSRGYKIT